MTKSIIAIIFAILPITAGAQTGWELPTNTKQQAENIAKKEKNEKKEKAGETKKKGILTPDMKDYEYLLPGVVPQDEKGMTAPMLHSTRWRKKNVGLKAALYWLIRKIKVLLVNTLSGLRSSKTSSVLTDQNSTIQS